jgi:formate dehydrogenase assembly factor FdhD
MTIGGASPREIPFSIDVKGGDIETFMRSDGHRGSMSMGFSCLSVSINDKVGDCWIVGLDNWLSLISTLGE